MKLFALTFALLLLPQQQPQAPVIRGVYLLSRNYRSAARDAH